MMEKNKSFTLIEVITLLAALSIILYCFSEQTTFLEFLNKWQTLIAGVFAIIAAFIAVAPVWSQLKVSEIQSAITSREALSKLLTELEERKCKTREVVDKLTGEFWEVLFPFGDDLGEEPRIKDEWAFHAESQVYNVLSVIRQFQEKRQDCDTVSDERETLISSLVCLEDCLREINLPINLGMNDEHNLTKEDIDKIYADSGQAKTKLAPLIGGVSKSARRLDGVFQVELEKYRNNIRRMDDFILNERI